MNLKTAPEIIIPPFRNDLSIIEGSSLSGNTLSWIIYDPVNGKYYRIEEKEHRIISLMSRELTLSELKSMLDSSGYAIDEKEIKATIDFLILNSLVISHYNVTESILGKRAIQRKSTRVQRGLSSLLFLRIPIWKPDQFLDSTKNIIFSVFNKWVLTVLVILSSLGYICVIPQWTRLTTQFYNSLTIKGIIQYSIAIILLKVLHEFAHAYTAKSLNVPVRKFGLFFIIFFPRLYTDLTDSWRIIDRKKRILIDSSGILLEVIAGGIGALIWLNTGTGAVNSIAYYILTVGTISAILVNGNPLIKFDGYFLLMDLLNIDNLQKTSTSVLRHFVYNKILGIKLEDKLLSILPRWKAAVLAVYSVASFIYRFFLYTGIILIIYMMFTKTLALILVAVEIYSLFVLPIQSEYRAVQKFKSSIKPQKLLLSYLGIAIILIILFIPIPWNIETPCELASLETQSIFVPYEGFLKKITAEDGQDIMTGKELFLLHNPFLEFDIQENKVNMELLMTEKHIASTNEENLSLVKIKEEQIEGEKRLLAENLRKLSLLQINSPIDGIFSLESKHLERGKWLKKGELIGQISNPEKSAVFAYVPEHDISRIKKDEKAYIRLNDDTNGFYGKISSISFVPSDKWRTSPLLQNSGGTLEILKQNRDGSFDLLKNYYRVTILPDSSVKLQEGRTGVAKIREYSSIAGNFFRFVLSLFHREFSF